VLKTTPQDRNLLKLKACSDRVIVAIKDHKNALENQKTAEEKSAEYSRQIQEMTAMQKTNPKLAKELWEKFNNRGATDNPIAWQSEARRSVSAATNAMQQAILELRQKLSEQAIIH